MATYAVHQLPMGVQVLLVTTYERLRKHLLKAISHLTYIVKWYIVK